MRSPIRHHLTYSVVKAALPIAQSSFLSDAKTAPTNARRHHARSLPPIVVICAVTPLTQRFRNLRRPNRPPIAIHMKRLLSVVLVILVAAASIFFILQQQHATAQISQRQDVFPVALRIHGSNTVGEKLMPELVQAFLQQQGYALVRIEAGAEPVEKRILASAHPTAPAVAVEIHAHGSSTAFTDLDKGLTDLGMSSRRIKPEEAEKLKARFGDLTATEQEHVIALDALAIIAHPDNPIHQLTVEQTAQIFAGDISDWSQLGLPAGPINRYARDDKSGTWDTFENLVLKRFEKKLAGDTRRFESSEALTESVRKDRNGIGFVGVAHATRIKLLSISADGKKAFTTPGKHTIGTEGYALSRRLFVYQPATLDNRLGADFLRFAVSDAGQKLVESAGLISYYPTRDKPRIASQPYPARYQSLGTLGERLSVNFRIDANTLVTDGKLQRDLDRINNFFRDNPDRQLVLAELKPGSAKASDADIAYQQLLQRLAETNLKVYDRVLVDFGPDNFDGLGAQFEVWAL